ncbi:hypothetical protein [Nocardioides zhouii]|uniref:Uncharacterized protein n=1 Tax=Nocardioides zhouii TaxID=1168729 RepID=A0A4Q2SWZ2_9ACTN|nr:hypothetical protein [Nocardioides zhouii]RYC10412.1 hypothetical protein EUA94_12845 [Nocardioides zhouii]
MTGRWLVIGVLLALATGCGEASSAPERRTPEDPAALPTEVPGAEGLVRSTEPVVVSDDGSGPMLCFGGISFGDPPSCSGAPVTGWDWSAVGDVSEDGGQRWGSYVLTGTFDGTTFAVEEVSQPDPEPDEWDFEILCPTPDGGWQVEDPARSTQDDLGAAMNTASGLPGFASGAVSTPDGEPGPDDPAQTVFSLYVVGDPAAAEAAIREVWGGMLCVTEVERTDDDFEQMQGEVIEAEVPGMSQVGGNLDNQLEIVVFHDDSSIQRWADQVYGEGVVVVESNLQPVG